MNKSITMIGYECIVDTSVVAQAFRKKNVVAERMDSMSVIYLPIIVIGELMFGAYRSANAEKHLLQINEFLLQCVIVYLDDQTATTYGKIKTNLMNNGTPIPENDIWIAAMALDLDRPLYAFDKHYDLVENLRVIK